MTRRRRQSRGFPVDGILLLDKPAGISSNAALQEAKHMLYAQKAGHTGSLDPLATGLLPLCYGNATKVSSFFLGSDKRYHVKIKLGVATDSGDSDGSVVSEQVVTVNREALEQALVAFKGSYEQMPPMYSALKVNGQPLYKLARQGIEIERKPRAVTVHRLDLLSFVDDVVELDVACSSGYYVRSLAMDLGEALGCGAHVIELRRTEVAGLTVDNAMTLEQLKAVGSPKDREPLLMSIDQALAGFLPQVDLTDNVAYYFKQGQTVRAAGLPDSGWVRIHTASDGFIGLGEVAEVQRVAPKRLFHQAG